MWKLIVVIIAVGLRWLLHVPSGMVSGQSWRYDWLIDLEKVYDEIPRAKGLPDGIVLAGTAGTIMIWWNFANAGLGPFVSFLGPFPLFIGLVDLGISLTLIVGLSKQGTFLPASYAGCNRIVDENNFFQVASAASYGLQTPQSLCRALVWNRAFSIAVVSLYMITTSGNLLLGVASIAEHIPSDIGSRICPSWVRDAGIRIKKTVSTSTIEAMKWPSTSLLMAREWWSGRKSTRNGKLPDDAGREEAIGLMPRMENPDDFELESGETRGLMVSSQTLWDDERKDSTDSSRWSGETVAGGRADARP
ncbi:hypothetical protein EDB81DRAFT_791774 [Dactylonectria macrodidyma]|uniref:Uncharacterized protein n=1 Tax=Dactylonectria macrodidyma TaxID=307937 RepID=A0A9P9EZ36_9HYPO|nr:hypothetical protein EDB81DRAFT_791774 [Dactylonectria macrodidyma]